MSGADSAANTVEGNARAPTEPDYRSMTYGQRLSYLEDFIVGDGLGTELKYRAACRALALKFGLAEGTIKKDIRTVIASMSRSEDVEERRVRSIITTQKIRETALDIGEPGAAQRAQAHLDLITGVAVKPQPAVQVNIIQQNESFRRLWEALGEALAPYPEAAAAVQARFERVMSEMTGAAPSMRLGSVDTEGEER